MVATIRDLDGDGADGDGTDITTTITYDDASRVVQQTDDNAHTTTRTYDALDRLVHQQMADQTLRQSEYDMYDNPILWVDANGSRMTDIYDLLNRRTNRAIVPDAGVSSDTTLENYQYDGRSRQVMAQDNDTTVICRYDSLSRVTRETLSISGAPNRTTFSTHDGVGNQTSCTYPGGLPIFTTFDDLDRKQTVSDNIAPFANYFYIGPDRVKRRVYSPNFPAGTTQTDYQYDGILPNPVGDFGVRRIVGTTSTHLFSGNIIDHRSYKYDRMGNKIERKDLPPASPRWTHSYEYDLIYRLKWTVVTVRNKQYDLDGVGNRTNVTGGPTPGGYLLDQTLPTPGDLQTNQYSVTPFDTRLYDENGNLIRKNDGFPNQQNLVYDYRNQMVQFDDAMLSQTHTYAYDCFGRRV